MGVGFRNITRKKFISITPSTTELLNFLSQKQDIDELFRSSLETAMNDLLQAELSAFLGYEPYDKAGYLTGNSRNGTYSRKFETKSRTVQLTIPRDRNGNFSPVLIPAYGRRDENLEAYLINTTIIDSIYISGIRNNYDLLFYDIRIS